MRRCIAPQLSQFFFVRVSKVCFSARWGTRIFGKFQNELRIPYRGKGAFVATIGVNNILDLQGLSSFLDLVGLLDIGSSHCTMGEKGHLSATPNISQKIFWIVQKNYLENIFQVWNIFWNNFGLSSIMIARNLYFFGIFST